MTSLNPSHTVERQVSEVLRVHKGLGKRRPGVPPSRCWSGSASLMRRGAPIPILTNCQADAPARHDRLGADLQSVPFDRR
jgi:ABC-type dipeptide/oligopeptide/nickel transport system ATPase component